MFKRNDGHLQTSMFDPSVDLPEKLQERLKASWSGTFYREFFCRLDETIFEPLYSEKGSRPNTAVNQLVAFEVLKAGQGWTDEQAYDAVCFDLQARHAMGLRRWGETPFTLRTVYNFRRAVADYAQTEGGDLFVKAFEQVTGEQQAAFDIGTRKVRMDSTQVASNMSRLGRLRLVASVTERMYRALDEEDQKRLCERFGRYAKDAKGLAYRQRGDGSLGHIVAIGDLMQSLIEELAEKYGETEAYRTMERVYREQYKEIGEIAAPRPGGEIEATGVQSPDDLDATFRRKGNKKYQGYVANVAESCDEENEQQLIVDVQVNPNSVDDARMLLDGIDELAERTQVETLHTDGGYNSAEVDEKLAEVGIEQVQTAIRGGPSRQLGRDAFDWEIDDDGRPEAVTCPNGQRVEVEQGRKSHTFVARFDATACQECPLAQVCPTKPPNRKGQRDLRFNLRQVHAARRQQRSRAQQQSDANPRAAVEATIWSMKSSMRRNRVPYRGLARVTMSVVAHAAMVNVRRLAKLTSSPTGTGTALSGATTASTSPASASGPIWGPMTALEAIVAAGLELRDRLMHALLASRRPTWAHA